MPTDINAFTHGLFDNTASPGWTHHAPSIALDAYEADADDADADDDTPPPPADPVARGSNFHLDGDRNLARGWTARARDNITAISLSKALEQSGRATLTAPASVLWTTEEDTSFRTTLCPG